MNSVLKITMLVGCSAGAALYGGQVGVNSQGDGGVQAAIRFEQAKQAADARQAGIAADRLQQGVVTPPVAPANQQVGVSNAGDGSVQAAIRFERAKAAADARQARVAAQEAADNANSAAGNADRRMTGRH